MINAISNIAKFLNNYACTSILNNIIRGYIHVYFIKQWRNRAVALMHSEFILVLVYIYYLIFLHMVKLQLVDEYLIIEVPN